MLSTLKADISSTKGIGNGLNNLILLRDVLVSHLPSLSSLPAKVSRYGSQGALKGNLRFLGKRCPIVTTLEGLCECQHYIKSFS